MRAVVDHQFGIGVIGRPVARRFARLTTGKCSHLLCYTLGRAVEWTQSAARHGIAREDALYAMIHHEATAELEGNPGERTVVYVGHLHGQTDRYIEVIAAHREPRTVVIFHAMELTDVYRHLLYEGNQ